MATRPPIKRKKAQKEFLDSSGGVGGPAGTIRAGKIMRSKDIILGSPGRAMSTKNKTIAPTRLLKEGQANRAIKREEKIVDSVRNELRKKADQREFVKEIFKASNKPGRMTNKTKGK